MEKIASTLLAFPSGEHVDRFDNGAYDPLAKSHVSKLAKLLKDQAVDIVTHGPQLLELLNPAVNSLSCVAVLHTLITRDAITPDNLDLVLEKLTLFLITFDARQSRYARAQLQDVFQAVGTGQLLPPSVAVEALAIAILRLDPTGSLLTPAHIQLVKLAYSTNNIEPVLQVIDMNIVFYPGMANYGNPKHLCDLSLSPPQYLSRDSGLVSSLKSTSVLEYDLVRGLIYCSQREWTKACDAFERVITFPTREGGTSKIMVETYKKWVLVSLLSKGKFVETPSSYTGVSAGKTYGYLAKPYEYIAARFVTDKAKSLKTDVEKYTEDWQEDGNTGLVQEVLAAYQKWQVLRLEQVYSKVSLSEIRQQTTSAETGQALEKDEDVETLLQNMIISGMLTGVIEKNDDGTTFLTFLPPSILLSEQDFAQELATMALRLKQLHPIFKVTKERLGSNKEYIKHIIKEEKRAEKNEPDPTLAFDAHVDDEDLMGGVVATG
ncbi:hypothetical protein M426DRAFT_316421 [Hypoxylon sp. CI-4A]|nr:hypothetical protein M426DRAFT_316421 [Hypoxylon sp. CI-4A]